MKKLIYLGILLILFVGCTSFATALVFNHFNPWLGITTALGCLYLVIHYGTFFIDKIEEFTNKTKTNK